MNWGVGTGSFARPRVGGGRWRRVAARFDWTLFFAVALIAGAGLLNLYSATLRTPHSSKFDYQVIWMLLGLGVYVTFTAIDYRTLHRLAWVGLGIAVVAMICVDVLADPIKGSERWLAFGPVRVQPSELSKIAVILAMARIFYDRSEGASAAGVGTTAGPVQIGIAVAGVVATVVLIAVQPDLGSASLTGLIAVSMSLLLLKNLVPMAVALVGGIAALPFLWDNMEDYQRSRVLTFLDRSADPTGAAWQTDQSINAVGSGRVTGKGFLEATQNHFDFLPEHWTDFPFSVWAEEWGFIGSVALLGVFLFLILWIVNVALNARDLFGQAICLGVAAMVFWHTVVNVLMILGLAPVVGVTLPLISYGGSSAITMAVGLGLVSSVSMRRQIH